jgi:hypothetical protein
VIPRYQVYRQRIVIEFAQIKRAAKKAQNAHAFAARGGADESYFVDATALNLHGFYNGIERLFEWLANEFDGTVPTGSAWHRDLLAQMTLEIPGVRPPVIRATTRSALEEYLRFRHIVRNLYTWDLEAPKVADLIARLPETLGALETDLAQFGAFLDAARRADD